MFRRMRNFFFALGGTAAALLVLYLLRQRGLRKPHLSGMDTLINVDEVHPVSETPARAIPAVPQSKPQAKPTPPTTKADNLKCIEGIGPKTEGLLNLAGITSFEALATLTPDEIKEILRAAKSRGVPTTWPKQAKLAASKNWEALKDLQKELKGGLNTSP